MAQIKEKTIDELLRLTEKLSEPKLSCVLEGKAKMRGPGRNDPSDDGDFGEVCENCKKPIHQGELSTCSTCERGFHTTCLELPLNALLPVDRLCKQCHELSSLQQRPSEASFKPSGAHRRKSTPSKAESLSGRQDLTSKRSALSSSQETSQQGSKSIASENDVVKTADSFDKGHSYVVETAGSFISEDSSRSKGGRGESSEQSLAPEPVRRSKRGRPYKPVGGLHPNKRRSVEHTSRHCDKGAQGRSRASTDEEDELGMKIEKFRGLKDLSSGKDVKDLKLVLPEDQKISLIEGSSLSLEPQSELAVKLEAQVAGKYGDSSPHTSSKLVEKKFEIDSKNSEDNDTAAENCVRRTGKITPVGRIVERSASGAEAAKVLLKTDNLGDSLSGVEISESLPATYTVTLKSENYCESVAGAISLDQVYCPQVARFECRDARIEPLDLTRCDTAGEDSGQSSRCLPVDVLELADTKSDQSKLVEVAVCGDRDDNAMETHSKPCIQDKFPGSLVIGQGVSNTDDRVLSIGHPGGATEGRNMTTMLTSVNLLDLKGQGLDHVLPFTSKSMNNDVAGGVEVGEIVVGVSDVSQSLRTEELTQHRPVVKSPVEECQMPETVLTAAPLPELMKKEGTPSSNCDATAEGSIFLGEGKSSKAEQSRDITSSFVVSHFPEDLKAITNHSVASSGNVCVQGLSAEASSVTAGYRTLDGLHQPSSLIHSTSYMPSGTPPSWGLVNREVDHQLPQSSPTFVLHAKGHTSVAANPEEAVDATTTLQGGSSTANSLNLVDITIATLPNNRISSDSLERKSQTRGRVPPSDGKTVNPCKGQLARTDEEAIDAIFARVRKGVEAYVGVAITDEAPKALSPPSRQSPLVDSKLIIDTVNHVSTEKFLHRTPTADSVEDVSTDSEFVKETFSSVSTPPTSNQTRLKVDIPGALRTNSAEEEDVSIKESANSSSVEEVEDIKVCDICGDPGYEECLAVCSACNEGAEHIYCMQALLVAVPVDGWMCEVCKAKETAGNMRQGERQISNLVSPGAIHGSPKKKSPTKGNTRSRLSARLDKGKGSPQKKGATKGAPSHPGSDKRPAEETVNPVPAKKQVVENAATSVPGNMGLAGRGLSREGSFKIPDSGKVKFLSPNALASIPVGGVGRNSGKSIGSAGTLSHLSRPGASPMGQSGNKSRFTSANSGHSDALSSHLLAGNKQASPVITPRSSAFPLTTPSPLSSNRGAGSQRSNESVPSFMRSSSMKGSAIPRAGKEAPFDGNGLPPSGRDSSSGGGNLRVGSNFGKQVKGSPFLHGVPEYTKWADTPRPSSQSSGSVMKSPRPKGDFHSALQPPDATGLSPAVERLKTQSVTSSGTSGQQQVSQVSQFYNEACRSNQEIDCTSRFRQDETRSDSPSLVGSKFACHVNLQSAKTTLSRSAPSTSELEVKSGEETFSKGKDAGELSKLESLRPPGVDVSEALRSTSMQKSAFKVSDESERRLPGSSISKIPMVKETILAEDATSSPKGLLSRAKDVKRIDISEGCWSALKNSPTMGSTRCYKCKEWGHTAQNCSNRSTPSSNYLEVGSTINPSPLSSLKNPRENLGGASSSILKGPRPNSVLGGAQIQTGVLSINGATSVNKAVPIKSRSIFLSDTPAEVEQTTSRSSPVNTAESTAVHDREELPRQGGLSVIQVRNLARVSGQSSPLGYGVSAGNVVTKAISGEHVGSIVSKDAKFTQVSTSKSVNQVRHLAPVLTQSGISAPGVSTGNLTPALGVMESPKPETETAIIENVPRNYSKEKSQASHVAVNPLARLPSIPGASMAVRPLEPSLVTASIVPPFSSLMSAWPQQRCPGIPELVSWGTLGTPLGARTTFALEGMFNQDTTGTSVGSMIYRPGAPPGPPFMSPGPAAVPETQCLWSGGFEVVSATSPAFYGGLEGFSSSFAAPKVRAVTKLLPSILQLEEVRRMLNGDAWPKQFQQKPPTDKEIALYFFPGGESSDKSYWSLVEHMMTNDLVLMGQVEGAEILIFPSHLLPADYHRWKNKLFLWGVYRAKKTNPLSTQQSGEVSGQACVSFSQTPSRLGPGGLQMEKQPGPQTMTAPSGGDSGEADMEIDMIGNKELGVPERPARKSGWDQPNSLPSPPLPREPAPDQPPPPGHAAISSQDGKRGEDTSPKDFTASETSSADLDVPPGFGPPQKQVSSPVGPHLSQNSSASGPVLQNLPQPVGPPGFNNTANGSNQKTLTPKPMDTAGYDTNQSGPAPLQVPPPPMGPPPFGPPGFEISPVGSSGNLPLVSVVPPGFETPANGSPALASCPGFDSSLGGTRSCESPLPSGPPGFAKVRDGLPVNSQVNSKCDSSLGNGGEVENPEKNSHQQLESIKREKSVVERRPYSRQASPMLAPSPSPKEFNEDSGFGHSRGSVHRLSRSSSKSPTRYRDRTRDSSAGRQSYHSRDRGRDKDRDRDRRRDRDRGGDRDRDRDRERDREKDRLVVRERDKFKEYRYKDRVDRPRDSKHRRHARSRSCSPSRSRSRSASKRRPRSPSVSPRKRRSTAKVRSKHRSRSHSDSPDSYHGRPSRKLTSIERRGDSREQSNEGSAVVRRVTPRTEDREVDAKTSGEEARIAEASTQIRGYSAKAGKQAEGIPVVLREGEYKSAAERTGTPIPFLDMNGPDGDVEEVQNDGEKGTVGTVPYFHVFLSAESTELLEVDTNEDVSARPFFPKGLPSPGASSSTFDLLQKHTATETYISSRSWEEEKTTGSSGYQFFPLEVGRVNDLKESEPNPNLELGLGGKDRKSTQTLVEQLPLFVLQDAAESSPDVTPCRFIEPPGFSSAPCIKDESQISEASSPLNLTLAVPQYRKEGNSWVKVDDTEATLGHEDVNFALTL
ncbi:hypothetical protein Mapa_016765 [Marchantia paleacea]|nr:hypothetical protein Mapa_016765 [Marchantia paleacea]